MPRINKKKTKELKQITSRLMQISLILDDYIYKQKTVVSVSDAEDFIKEVASYKTLCKQQPRSLQVIEKITRCMKAIIIEQNENSNEAKSQTTPDNTKQPNKIVPNQKSTIISDNAKEDNSKTKEVDETIPNKTISTKSKNLEQDTATAVDDIIPNTTNSPTCSLFDEETTQFSQDILAETGNYWNDDVQTNNASLADSCANTENAKRNQIASLEKAISIISIEDNDDDQACSQSLLSNFEPNINAKDIITDKTDTLQINNEGAEVNKPEKAKGRQPNKKNNLSEVIVSLKQTNDNIINIQKTKTNEKSTVVAETTKTANKEKKQNERKRKFKAPTKTNTDKISNTTDTKRTRQKKDKQDISKDTPKRQNKNNNIINAQKQNTIDNSITSSETLHKESTISKEPISELSWMENLKYVRIVNDSEYDKNPKLDKNFWNNLTLPSDWTDHEFDV